MPDPDIVKVRLSGTDIGRLADQIAALDGWTVVERSAPRKNRRDPGERVYLTVVPQPPSGQILAWMAANGWVGGSHRGAYWQKAAPVHGDAKGFDAPTEWSPDWYIRNVLEWIAAAEGLDLGELVALIVKAAANG